MSIFGLLIGVLIVYVVFSSKQNTNSLRHLNLIQSMSQKNNNVKTKEIMPLPSDEGLIKMRSLVTGPFWNTFYTPTYWNVDDQFLWPYWVWNQKGFLMPGPLYPYYNG